MVGTELSKRAGRDDEIPVFMGRREGAMTRKFNFNTVAAVAFIVLAIVMYVTIPSQIEKPLIVLPEEASNLKAEFFPQLVATLFLVLGVWFFFKSFTIDETQQFRELDRTSLTNVVVTLVVMAAYGPLMMTLGFVVSSAIMIAVLATFYGNRNYALTAIIAIGVPVAIFFTFTKLLATSLPPFPIDTILTRYFIL